MGFRSRALALVAASLVVTGAAAADVAVVFSKNEIAIIRDYYSSQPRESAGKGQQKKQTSKPLPPGIAKNLARGKPLPPGIAKQRLPDDLIRRLPLVSAGYERVIVDGRLLLVAVATQVIADVLSDVIFN